MEPTAEEIERVAKALFAATGPDGCKATHGNFDILMPEIQDDIRIWSRAAIRASQPAPAVAVPADPHIDGNQWVAGRDAFVKYADRYAAANKHEEAMAIADVAPAQVFKAMLAAAPQPPARGVADGSVLVPKAFLEFVKNAPVSSGDNMGGHADPMSCGHTPRDQWEYSLSQWLEEIASPAAPAVAVTEIKPLVKRLMSYLFGACQPDRGDVFDWMDDHAEEAVRFMLAARG